MSDSAKIEYRKGSLFDAPEGAILAHACNGRGVWGAGIAAEFRKRFPNSEAIYKFTCQKNSVIGVDSGYSFVVEAEGPKILCLITSSDYGRRADSAHTILRNTEMALKGAFSWLKPNTEIHSPKINSGLFRVPWELTETIINRALKTRPDIKWVVWEME